MHARRFLVLLFTVLLATLGLAAHAQGASEPTVHEIYQAATRGDLAGARTMVDQVVAKHPDSAKAHYVKAEIAARQRDAATARTELQAAERIAPGLPFAKPEAVTALRSAIDRPVQVTPTPRSTAPAEARGMGAPPRSGGGGFPMGSLLLVAVIAAAVFFFLRMRRLRSQPPMYPQGLDQGFGRHDAPPAGPGYGGVPPGAGYPPGYPPQYPPQGGSLGGSIGRGLATGLAVGAGAVAAQEIGHRMFDHDRPADGSGGAHSGGSAAGSSLSQDAGIGGVGGEAPRRDDMGGNDFGIADNGGWDDGGGGNFGVDDGGGSDDWNT